MKRRCSLSIVLDGKNDVAFRMREDYMKAKVAIVSVALLMAVFAASCGGSSGPDAPNPAFSSAALTSLSISAGATPLLLGPAFYGNVTSYAANAPYSESSVDVAATADTGASISGIGRHALAVGANAIDVVVTAADGVSQTTYTVTVNRAGPGASTIASISELSIAVDGSTAALTPRFTGETLGYQTSVDNAASNIEVTATPTDHLAVVSVFGATGFAMDVNTVSIVVTAADGVTKKTYTVQVNHHPSLYLASLQICENDRYGLIKKLSPAFSGDVRSYFVNIVNFDTAWITATALDPAASISGTGSRPLTDNGTIEVVVRSADGTKSRTYSITTILGVPDNRLQSVRILANGVEVSQDRWDTQFNPNLSGTYTIKVGNDVSAVQVLADAVDRGGQVEITGKTTGLTAGYNSFSIASRYSEATLQQYDFRINKAPSLANYVGTWDNGMAGTRHVRITIGANGSFTHAHEASAGHIATFSGTLTVGADGGAVFTARTFTDGIPYTYDSSADALVIHDYRYTRVGGAKGARIGLFEYAGERFTLNADHSLVRAEGGASWSGRWDANYLNVDQPDSYAFTALLTNLAFNSMVCDAQTFAKQ